MEREVPDIEDQVPHVRDFSVAYLQHPILIESGYAPSPLAAGQAP